jgi:hypothetical protein
MRSKLSLWAVMPLFLFGLIVATDNAHADDAPEPTPIVSDTVGPIQSLAVVSADDPSLAEGARSLTIRDRVLVDSLRDTCPDIAAYREGNRLHLAAVGLPEGELQHLSDCSVNSRFEGSGGLSVTGLDETQLDRLHLLCEAWARVRHAAAAPIEASVTRTAAGVVDVTFRPASALSLTDRESFAPLVAANGD